MTETRDLRPETPHGDRRPAMARWRAPMGVAADLEGGSGRAQRCAGAATATGPRMDVLVRPQTTGLAGAA